MTSDQAAEPAPHDRDEVELERLLAEAGARLSGAELEALVAGVAAAPEGLDPTAWTRLVAPDPGPELTRRLLALRAAGAEDGIGEAGAAAQRLAALRAELKRHRLAGFIVPLADEHQGEYVARRSRRLAWLTGFTGSAGLAVVLPGAAAVFIDGRYTLQAEKQVDGALYACLHLTDEPPHDWIAANLGSDERLGYDPWLHTLDQRERIAEACRRAGGELVACDDNPIDAIWVDQPAAPIAPVVPHDIRFAGESAADKRAAIAEGLREGSAQTGAKADAAVLTAPDSIAWLLNIRGGDVACSPLALSFAIIADDGRVDWFVDRRKLVPELAAHLGPEVDLHPPEALERALDALGEAGKTVRVDPAGAPALVFDRLEAAGAAVAKGPDPCARPKACKNPTELAGARAAHLRDGAALVRFLCWLDKAVGERPVTELEAAAYLDERRRETERYQGPSFQTISGAGPNGAIVHYRATPETNRTLEPGTLFLVDSGGQYLDGTTDITRTVAIGEPTPEHRHRFTAVLKGHIAIATVRFPKGTAGISLDSLARQALWQAGLDYDHGTGHGVGSYLGVHEGPQRIAKRGNAVALEAGMIVSNEPGYYKSGAYGIRIENMVVVVVCDDLPEAERAMLAFETLSRAPIDRALIDAEALTPTELTWLDGYHAEVREALAPLLDGETAAWLAAATRSIGER